MTYGTAALPKLDGLRGAWGWSTFPDGIMWEMVFFEYRGALYMISCVYPPGDEGTRRAIATLLATIEPREQ